MRPSTVLRLLLCLFSVCGFWRCWFGHVYICNNEVSTFPHTSILSSGADNYFNAYDALLLESRTVLSGARRQSFLTFCERYILRALPLHDSGPYPSPILLRPANALARAAIIAAARTAAAAAFPAEPFPPALLQPSTQSRPSPTPHQSSSMISHPLLIRARELGRPWVGW